MCAEMRVALQWSRVLATLLLLAMVGVMMLPFAFHAHPREDPFPRPAKSPWPDESHPAVIQQRFYGITPDRLILYTSPGRSR